MNERTDARETATTRPKTRRDFSPTASAACDIGIDKKTGVFYWQEQAGRTAGGRGMLAGKVVVSWQGEPLELGRRLNHEGMCRGLGRSLEVIITGVQSKWAR